MAGFSGSALLNLVFLPRGAVVIELNTHGLYADYWQWAHALRFGYRHIVPPSVITNASQADTIARSAYDPEPSFEHSVRTSTTRT